MTHSGSRGPGAKVANHFCELAMRLRKGLPDKLKHLAWLDMNSPEGKEYWAAMEIMGNFAKASHEIIHNAVLHKLHVAAVIENHHNFAWKEQLHGQNVIVHRKGATPAHAGVLGVIPGSMSSPAYIVRGKGNDDSINSASHGAGRLFSRTKANNTISAEQMKQDLIDNNVHLVNPVGRDEARFAYKDIHQVMANQSDLVETMGLFHPRIVKMAPPQRRKRRKK